MLRWWLGDQVLHPDITAYADSRASYWSQQEASLAPTCIVRPRHTHDVSTAVWILSTVSRFGSLLRAGGQCRFAIRGGGHTPFVGSANIDGGVTIDLSAMRDVVVRPDRSITSVGPGATWLEVYMKLDAMDLAVSGGRVSSVGVAGLTLGGSKPVRFHRALPLDCL